MTDLSIVYSDGTFDLALTASDIELDEGLRTAVFISLFTDRRATLDEELPAGIDSRRGWWGDTYPDTPEDRIGSRLWLLSREKMTPALLVRAKQYCEEALQWLILDGVAQKVTVVTERNTVRFDQMDIGIEIFRPSGQLVNYKFAYNWAAQIGAF